MSEQNLYAAPKSQLIEADEPVRNEFYVVALLKFRLLYYFTLGIYSIYWFWRHWQTYRRATGESLWPIPRAIFNIFFTHDLFGKFDERMPEKRQWHGMVWATVYVASAVISRITDRLGADTIGILDLVSLLLFVAMGESLARGQQVANEACNDPEGKTNSHYSAANVIFMVIGGLLSLTVYAALVLLYFYPELLVE